MTRFLGRFFIKKTKISYLLQNRIQVVLDERKWIAILKKS